MAYKHLIVALEVEGLQHGKILVPRRVFTNLDWKVSKKIRENWNWRELETSFKRQYLMLSISDKMISILKINLQVACVQ